MTENLYYLVVLTQIPFFLLEHSCMFHVDLIKKKNIFTQSCTETLKATATVAARKLLVAKLLGSKHTKN